MEDFDNMADFNELVYQAHKREIKVTMDLVANHTSDEHEWFIKAKSSKLNPYKDYYFFKKGRDKGEPPNSWESWFGGSTWEYNHLTEEYFLHLFSKNQPDLNWENINVRKEIYKVMKFWISKGVDGFRLDAINFLSKCLDLPDSSMSLIPKGKELYLNVPKIHEYLREMNREVFGKYDIFSVVEVVDISPIEAKKYVDAENKELGMLISWDHMFIDCGEGGLWDIGSWKLTDLKKIITEWQKELDEVGWNAIFLSNHDNPRQVSRFGDAKRFRKESAKMLAALILTLKGTPFLYQGEKIGMTNAVFKDISECNDVFTVNMYEEEFAKAKNKSELMKIVNYRSRDHARTPMQWANSTGAGFTTGPPWIKINENYKFINVEESIKDEESIFNYYRRLINLRKSNDIFVYGNYEIILEANNSIFAYFRNYKKEKLLVTLNFSKKNCVFELNKYLDYENVELLISNYSISKFNDNFLRPYEARVYKIMI